MRNHVSARHLGTPELGLILALGVFVSPASQALAADPNPPSKPGLALVEAQPSPARPTGWRGDGTGQYPLAQPPTQWADGQNVRWKSEVGAGQSSPIVVGNRVVIASEPDLLICLDAETGRELWRKSHPLSAYSPEAVAKGARHSSQYGDATPTPVSDGRWVWNFFGIGVVACHGLDGSDRWAQWYDLRQTTPYGRTASPVLVGDRLLVHFGPLVCLEAATGKVLWQNEQVKATYGTPAVARLGGVDVVIAPKGQVVRVADGRILAADLGNCMYTSPVVENGVAYFMDGAMTALRLPGKAADDLECQELWSGELTGEFFASPLVEEGRIHLVDKTGQYYVVDGRTGKTMLSRKLEFSPAEGSGHASAYPSPCRAGGKLFVGNDAGEMIILEPGAAGRVVGRGSLPGGSGGTATFKQGRIFVRGGKFLYCL